MNNLGSDLSGQQYGPGKPSRRKVLHLLAAKLGFIALLAQGAPAMAAEIKVMAGVAMTGVIGDPRQSQALLGAYQNMAKNVVQQVTVNGIDLEGFYSWFEKAEHELTSDKDSEPVFSVRDGILRISGKRSGGLSTSESKFLRTLQGVA